MEIDVTSSVLKFTSLPIDGLHRISIFAKLNYIQLKRECEKIFIKIIMLLGHMSYFRHFTHILTKYDRLDNKVIIFKTIIISMPLLVNTTFQSELRSSFRRHIYVVRINFINEWRDLQFKVSSK